jgi:hypothetical protein
MTAVWYLGKADRRTISPADWVALGTTGGTFLWDGTNGYSHPVTDFTAPQLTALGTQLDFNTAAADGARAGAVVSASSQPWTADIAAGNTALQALNSKKQVSWNANNLSVSDPFPVSLWQTTFLAYATSMLMQVEVTGAAVGATGASIDAFVCDVSLGRRPIPSTQVELQGLPATIQRRQIGVIPPLPLTNDYYTNSGAAKQSTVLKTTKLSGLIVGHTYTVEITSTITGGASKTAPMTDMQTYQSRLALVGSAAGKMKSYSASCTASKVMVNVWSAGETVYVKPTVGPVIATAAPAYAVRATPTNDRVLLSTYTSAAVSSVQVVDTSTDSIIASYPTTTKFVNDFAISSDGLTAWLMQPYTASQVQAITISSGAVVRTIATTGLPYRAVLSPDGTRIHVLTTLSGSTYIETYSTTTGAAVGGAVVIAVGTGNALDITPNGLFLYLYVNETGTVYEVNLTTRAVSRSLVITTGSGAASLKILAGDTARSLLVFLSSNSSVSVCYHVRLDTMTVYTQWPALNSGGYLSDGAIGPRGDRAARRDLHARLHERHLELLPRRSLRGRQPVRQLVLEGRRRGDGYLHSLLRLTRLGI